MGHGSRRYGDILKVVRHFLDELERSGVRLVAVYLYGSQATGTAGPDSDIDVALISEDFTGDWLEDHRKIVDALLRSDARIKPVRFRPEQFCDEPPLAWEIKTRADWGRGGSPAALYKLSQPLGFVGSPLVTAKATGLDTQWLFAKGENE